MMGEREFYENVRECIIGYLPLEYEFAEITLTQQIKHNDIEQTGISIRLPNESVTPVIYLNSYYEQYQEGRDIDEIMTDLAQVRIQAAEVPVMDVTPDAIRDYDSIRPNLQMRIFDTEKNRQKLENIVHHSFGDFSSGYCVVLGEDREHTMSMMVTPAVMDMWGITKKRLHDDTILADLSHGPVLSSMEGIMQRMFDGTKPTNYLESPEAALPGHGSDEVQLFCLSNDSCINGAGLVLNSVVQEKIAHALGANYYVLPSSIHEVLIVPDFGDRERINAKDLGVMVHEINETTVSPSEVLSDKVQYYDASARKLMNAAAYEQQHERDIGQVGRTKPKTL